MLPLPWHNLDFYYRKFVCPFKNYRILDDLSFQLSDLTNYGIEFGIELNDQSKILDHAQAFKFTEQKQNESNVDEQRLDRQLQSNLRRSNRLIYALKFALKMKSSIILGIMCVPFVRRFWQMKIKFEFFTFFWKKLPWNDYLQIASTLFNTVDGQVCLCFCINKQIISSRLIFSPAQWRIWLLAKKMKIWICFLAYTQLISIYYFN